MNETEERHREICRRVREAKSLLIDIDGELYRAGFHGSSKSLGRIIAQLERWEAKKS